MTFLRCVKGPDTISLYTMMSSRYTNAHSHLDLCDYNVCRALERTGCVIQLEKHTCESVESFVGYERDLYSVFFRHKYLSTASIAVQRSTYVRVPEGVDSVVHTRNWVGFAHRNNFYALIVYEKP